MAPAAESSTSSGWAPKAKISNFIGYRLSVIGHRLLITDHRLPAFHLFIIQSVMILSFGKTLEGRYPCHSPFSEIMNLLKFHFTSLSCTPFSSLCWSHL